MIAPPVQGRLTLSLSTFKRYQAALAKAMSTKRVLLRIQRKNFATAKSARCKSKRRRMKRRTQHRVKILLRVCQSRQKNVFAFLSSGRASDRFHRLADNDLNRRPFACARHFCQKMFFGCVFYVAGAKIAHMKKARLSRAFDVGLHLTQLRGSRSVGQRLHALGQTRNFA
jgi:hypothetical protein